MAYVTQDTQFRGGLLDRCAAIVARGVKAAKTEMFYRRTMRELSALDDATLSDLGLNRSQLPSIAREAIAAK